MFGVFLFSGDSDQTISISAGVLDDSSGRVTVSLSRSHPVLTFNRASFPCCSMRQNITPPLPTQASWLAEAGLKDRSWIGSARRTLVSSW